MGALLAEARRSGMPWSTQCYQRLVSAAVADLDRYEADNWIRVFSEQSELWHEAYERRLAVRNGHGLNGERPS
jgi:hypothetical protein